MNISEFDKCSNCGGCYNICPHNAITVNEDSLFYRPVVNFELCVDCGLCTKVCPVNTEFEGFSPIEALAGWHKEENVVMSSSSGGIFWGIAQYVLNYNGVVYGATYSEDSKEVVFMSSEIIGLDKLQKSKYVESKVEDSFRRIKDELNKKRYVLFCGTPCQVAGLKKYLGKEYKKLITCDFVCGGLPSHKLYAEYLGTLEKTYKSSVKKVDFRPKTHGWKRYAVLVEFENGKKYNRLGVEDPFLRSFLYGKYTVRDYCLECKFSDSHLSDVTIADFWLHENLSKLKNDKGNSLAICNTEIGKHILDNIKADYVTEKINLEFALYNHKKTQVSEMQKNNHDSFLQESINNGFMSAHKLFFKDTWKIKIKNRIARNIFKRYK